MKNLIDLVGNTPMVEAEGIGIKLEYLNPTGSHKDRIALSMIINARSLRKGSVVVEYTSGNTGISVAWAASILGYRAIILVPKGTEEQKIRMIRAFGANVVMVNENEDGHEIAEQIAKDEGGVYLHQTRNAANYQAHYTTTGPEILRDSPNSDCFVMGMGTGGTVYGVGKYLKEHGDFRVVALLPKGSYAQEILTGKNEVDEHIMEGFSYHSFSEIAKKAIDEGVVDEIIFASSKDALEGMKILFKHSIPGGPTSGANFYHALSLKKRCKPVTIAADSAIRYPDILKRIF